MESGSLQQGLKGQRTLPENGLQEVWLLAGLDLDVCYEQKTAKQGGQASASHLVSEGKGSDHAGSVTSVRSWSGARTAMSHLTVGVHARVDWMQHPIDPRVNAEMVACWLFQLWLLPAMQGIEGRAWNTSFSCLQVFASPVQGHARWMSSLTFRKYDVLGRRMRMAC